MVKKKINIPKKYLKEVEHLRKTGIPRCIHCHTNFVNGYDSITKQISKYYFVPNCSCSKDKIGVMVG